MSVRRPRTLAGRLAALQIRSEAAHCLELKPVSALAEREGFLAAGLAHPEHRLRLLGPASAPRAFALQWPEANGWTGRPHLQAAAGAAQADPGAVAWMGGSLAELSLARSGEYLLTLNPSHLGALPALEQVGLGIDSVIQLGRTRLALDRLRAERDPPPHLDALGLRLRPMQPGDIEAAIRLKERVFRAAPQWAWFGAWPEHLARTRLAWHLALSDPASQFLVIEGGQTLRGVISAQVDAPPSWGPCAGIDLILAPEIQGRGVLWTAYRILLEGLQQRGIPLFKGGTAQPAVMGLGVRLGRTVIGLTIRGAVRFRRAHFALALRGP